MTFLERTHEYGQLIRWHKPIGSLLILWPVLAALSLANHGQIPALLLFIFVLGTFVMRAAGCILNDLADMKFDKHVARTQNRPLTTGTVKVWEALILLAGLLIIALALVLQLNLYCLILAVIGVLLSIVYPFMKRFIPLPQGVLGIVFNLGTPMAYAASHNTLPFSGWLLFVISILWTIAYDTMYAMSDRKDDMTLGLKSSAIWFGKKDRCIVGLLQLVVLVLLILLGLITQLNLWFYLGILATGLSFMYQQFLIKRREPLPCLQAFTNNHWSWFFIFFGAYLSFH